MVICKYFLRGTCRFGENCKNEHNYNENSESVMRKKADVDPNIIIKSVSNDMDKAEKGNQWPFSCYGPFQGKPCFPGFEDKCFEEIRLGLYEAEKNGTAEQYKQQLTQLVHETRMKMRSLQHPTPEATNVLLELFHMSSSGNQSSNIFTNNTSIFNSNFSQSTNPSPSVFGNTAASQSVFSSQTLANNNANKFTFTLPENKNIFGNTTTQNNSNSPFGQNSQTFSSGSSIFGNQSGKTIFGNLQTNFISPNVFETTVQPNQTTNNNIFNSQQNNPPLFAPQPVTGGNIFAQNVSSQPNIFAQNTTDPFKQNTPDPFKQNNQTEPSFTTIQNAGVSNSNIFSQSNVFGQNSILQTQNQGMGILTDHTKNIFGMTPVTNLQTESRKDDPTVYSKVEELSENDRKYFEAKSFEFGQIPEKPPTIQMCS